MSRALINADPREIVFTSGATEANNLALKGVAHFAREHPPAKGEPRDEIVTFTTEHKCVLESAAALEREGFVVTILPVEPNGLDFARTPAKRRSASAHCWCRSWRRTTRSA